MTKTSVRPADRRLILVCLFLRLKRTRGYALPNQAPRRRMTTPESERNNDFGRRGVKENMNYCKHSRTETSYSICLVCGSELPMFRCINCNEILREAYAQFRMNIAPNLRED